MRGVLPLPLWALALVLAVLAPFMARAVASIFARRSRERSRRVLASARLDVRDAAPTIDGAPRTD